MNIENTASQMRKGVLEFCVLSVIRQGEAYPSDIIDKMKAANFQMMEGTLYPLLTRLKNANMLSYRWVESNSGPPRKYFNLTESGLLFYQELEATWNEMATAVEAVKHQSLIAGEPISYNRQTAESYSNLDEMKIEQPYKSDIITDLTILPETDDDLQNKA
jgi:PadR family transcriptional regulator, regulatory protein PadR